MRIESLILGLQSQYVVNRCMSKLYRLYKIYVIRAWYYNSYAKRMPYWTHMLAINLQLKPSTAQKGHQRFSV